MQPDFHHGLPGTTAEDAEDAEVQSCPFDFAQGTPSIVEG